MYSVFSTCTGHRAGILLTTPTFSTSASEICHGRTMLTQRPGTVFSFELLNFPKRSILASCRNRCRYIPQLSSHTQGSKPLTCWWGAFQNGDERDKSTPKSHTSFRNYWFYISCYLGSYTAVTVVSWKHTNTGFLTPGAVRIQYCSSSNPFLEVQPS